MAWAAHVASDAQHGAALKIHARAAARWGPGAPEHRASLRRELRASGVPVGAMLTAERSEFAEAVPGWLGQWQAALGDDGRDGVIVLVQQEDEGVALDVLLMAPAAGTEHVD